MRQYIIAFWILSILSVSHFTLAAPVAVNDMFEVRSQASNAVVVKDGIAAWKKRMDDDPPYDNSVPNEHHSDPWQMESDDRTPDKFYNDDPYDPPNSSLNSDTNYDSETEEGDDRGSDDDDNGSGSDDDSGDTSDDDNGDDGQDDYTSYDNEADDYYYGDGGHHEDDDGDNNEEDDNGGRYEGDNENTDSLGLMTESGGTPEHKSFLEDLLKFRPRNSGSGAVMSKKDSEGTVDARA